MNYNINIDEMINDDKFNNDKIVIQKKNYYCSNCNRKGHTFKNCNEPIISNGIIAIYIKNFNHNLIPYLENYIVKNLKIFNNTYNKKTSSPNFKKSFSTNSISTLSTKNISSSFSTSSLSSSTQSLSTLKSYSNSSLNNWFEECEKKNNFLHINEFSDNINDNIQFLMVQRKHSLGYLEFMRGRYTLENIDNIIYLIKQMSPNEINDISNEDFDFLWNNLWDSNNIKNKNHHKEYIQSKQKFYQLKLNNPKLISDIKPLYEFNEWGFPKGRRESYESDLVCAIREFEEETNLEESIYTILDKCKSIRENLTGTNGVQYAHNYFLSIINDNLNEDFIDESNREIGQTSILDINECLKRIRPYHKNKIRIIKHIYLVINDFLNEYSKFDFE